MDTYKILPFLILIFLVHSGISQENVKVRAIGKVISNEMSPKQARFEALKEAKYNALRNAGVAENIKRSSVLLQSDDGKHFNDLFNDLVSVSSNGEAIVDSILWEKRKFNEFGNMELSLEIEATVFKTKSNFDPNFYFKVNGLKNRYNTTDKLNFSFIPTDNGYLTIFNVTDESATIIYPYIDIINGISDKKNFCFQEAIKIDFPIHPAFQPGYILDLPNTGKPEINRLIFVFTKTKLTFIESPNLTTIFSWISIIPPNIRSIFIHEFLIE